MARPKKDSSPVTIRMDQKVYDCLTSFCERSGLSKTVVIERALTEYIDAYNQMMDNYLAKKEK